MNNISKFFLEPLEQAPKEEFENSFYRCKANTYYKLSSLKGRVICIVVLPLHLLGTLAKTFLYLTYTVAIFATGLFASLSIPYHWILNKDTSLSKQVVKDLFSHSKEMAFKTALSPIGQVAQVIKAAAGILHPGAYFKPYVEPPFFRNGQFTIQINCAFADLKNEPFKVLNDFAKNIQGRIIHNAINVAFSDQPAVDAGGPGKEYIYKLARGVKNQLRERFKIDLGKAEIPDWNSFEEMNKEAIHQVFQDLAQLIKFSSRKNWGGYYSPFVIGDLFHPIYFSLLLFTHEQICKKFKNLDVKTLLTLGRAIGHKDTHRHFDSLNEFLEWKPGIFDKNNEKHITFIKTFYKDFFDEEVPKNLFNVLGKVSPRHLNTIKKEIVNFLMMPLLPKIETLHVLSQGFIHDKKLFENLQQLGPEKCQEYLQGSFDKETFLAQLKFSENFNIDRKSTIQNFLKERSDEELKNFLCCVNNSPCTAKVEFEETNHNILSVGTCEGYIKIPRHYNSDDVIRGLLDCCQPDDLGFNSV